MRHDIPAGRRIAGADRRAHGVTWSVVLYLRFLRGRGSFAAREKWPTDYLPVYSTWAAIVVILFPPVFGFI